MSRGLTDPIPEPEQSDNELEQVIRDLIIGQNKLHDRLVQLEREMDQVTYTVASIQEDATKLPKKKWHKGL